MMDIIDLMGLFDEMDDTHVARVNIEAESITGAKLQLTIGDPEEEAATDPEEETSEKEPEGEKKPEEKKPKLSDAEIKQALKEVAPKRRGGRPRKSTDAVLDDMAKRRGEL